MQTLKARIHKHRLILDEPTNLPEGTGVELVVLHEVFAMTGAPMTDEERAALDRELEASSDDERVAHALNDTRHLFAEADACAHAAADYFKGVIPIEDPEGRRWLERGAQLVNATASAVQVALAASDKLAAELAPVDAAELSAPRRRLKTEGL